MNIYVKFVMLIAVVNIFFLTVKEKYFKLLFVLIIIHNYPNYIAIISTAHKSSRFLN